MLSQKIQDKIRQADLRMNKIQGWESNDVSSAINNLMHHGSFEVGYRSQCGSTHKSQKTYNEIVRIIALLRKEGFEISEESVKHKNAYATNNGGFWNSTIFTIKTN